jgi:hypothetical protein
VSASLLRELGYRVDQEPALKRRRLGDRTPPKSPTFAPSSPDYTPSDEEFSGERSRSESPELDYERLLEQSRTFVELAETRTAEVNGTLKDLRYKYGRLRSRVIYLEGELAVYQRFASVQRQQLTTAPGSFSFITPPPPPRRA